MYNFITNKKNPKESSWETTIGEEEILQDTLQENEILFQIHKISFTANNVSYAITGDKLGYWNFFPYSKNSDFGKIPAWGFAKVVQSKHAQVKVDEYFYGYFPVSDFLKVKAEKVSPSGFFDVSTHRTSLPAVYNFYANSAHDLLYMCETEDFQAIFRPLFTTSFLLDIFLAENNFFEATQIILTSASSKTAFALAFLLQERKTLLAQNTDNSLQFPEIIALTSEKNVAFVRRLGLYDNVFMYDECSQIPQYKTTIVDFAGNQNLHQALQHHLGENLGYNCLVGASHWDDGQKEGDGSENLKKGKFFFAPTYAQKLAQTIGNTAFHQNIADAWQNFALRYNPIIEIEATQNLDVFQDTFQEMLAGNYPANKSFIFKFV